MYAISIKIIIILTCHKSKCPFGHTTFELFVSNFWLVLPPTATPINPLTNCIREIQYPQVRSQYTASIV